MQINSLNDLKNIKEESIEKVFLRTQENENNKHIEIRVQSTVPAENSREILNSFVNHIKKQNLRSVKAILEYNTEQTETQPSVHIIVQENEPIVIENVTLDKVTEILDNYISDSLLN